MVLELGLLMAREMKSCWWPSSARLRVSLPTLPVSVTRFCSSGSKGTSSRREAWGWSLKEADRAGVGAIGAKRAASGGQRRRDEPRPYTRLAIGRAPLARAMAVAGEEHALWQIILSSSKCRARIGRLHLTSTRPVSHRLCWLGFAMRPDSHRASAEPLSGGDSQVPYLLIQN